MRLLSLSLETAFPLFELVVPLTSQQRIRPLLWSQSPLSPSQSVAKRPSAIWMNTPTATRQTPDPNGTLNLDPVPAYRERVVIQAVACPSHLPDKHFPQGGSLLDQRENNHSRREKLLDPITTDQPRAFDHLSSHQGRRSNVLQEKPDLEKDLSKRVQVCYPKAEAWQRVHHQSRCSELLGHHLNLGQLRAEVVKD